MIALSPDGYVRLTFGELLRLSMTNIYTESDEGIAEDLRVQGVPATHAGVTEWCSGTVPAISLGLTYFVGGHDSSLQGLHLAPEPVRGNVMLVDSRGYDLGRDNETLLRLWGDLFGWRESVAEQSFEMH